MIDEALSYTRAGFPVFPLHRPVDNYGPGAACSCGNPRCSNVGKHPRTPNGLKDATTNEDQIIKWWNRWPDANIGLPTGPVSGLLVVDADHDGAKGWLTENQGLFPLSIQATSGRGLHAYYFYPEKTHVPNTAGKVAAGIDIRGNGGYVVAPPSLHRSGQRYKWLGADIRDPNESPQELSEDAIERLRKKPVSETEDVPEEIFSGGRNDALIRFAGAARRWGSNEKEIRQYLLAVNEQRCKPPLPRSEVEAIARGATRYDTVGLTDLKAAATGPVMLWDRDRLDQMEPPQWLVKDHIPKNALSTLYGPPGVGKTFVALDMALSIATGVPFSDEFPVDEGHVVYIAAEGAWGLAPRVKAWEKSRGVRADKLYIVPDAVQLLDSDHVQRLLDELQRTFDIPKLIVFDTLARSMVGGDENAALDMGQAIQHIDAIRDRFADDDTGDGPNIMLIHHSSKDGLKERGSTALRGAMDTMLSVQNAEPGQPGKWLNCAKQKDFAEFDSRLFYLQDVEFDPGNEYGKSVVPNWEPEVDKKNPVADQRELG